ncbi:hypothetical protein [Kocuria nitroreducens]|uniref:hypothetical protein n=1 Tax=Kocuria nitroreducens TaxID=3058914 RepID=UPI0036DB1D95
MTVQLTTRQAVAHDRGRRTHRRRTVTTVLTVLIVAMFALTLMAGQTFYSPTEVLRVILADDVAGASFTVGRLSLDAPTLIFL